jgi:hypothetical protein
MGKTGSISRKMWNANRILIQKLLPKTQVKKLCHSLGIILNKMDLKKCHVSMQPLTY